HLRQSSFQSGNKKFCLEIDCVGQKAPQLVHLSGILRFQKLGTRIPRARRYMAGAQKQRRQLRAAIRYEAYQLWKTFFEGALPSLRIPDEVADAERCEIFTLVP